MTRISLKTFDKAKKKTVFCGYVENVTYYKRVNRKHFMIKYNGYGIQSDVFQKLPSINVTTIIITTPTSTIYKASLGTWSLKGEVHNDGHGSQVFLNIKEMERTTPSRL